MKPPFQAFHPERDKLKDLHAKVLNEGTIIPDHQASSRAGSTLDLLATDFPDYSDQFVDTLTVVVALARRYEIIGPEVDMRTIERCWALVEAAKNGIGANQLVWLGYGLFGDRPEPFATSGRF